MLKSLEERQKYLVDTLLEYDASLVGFGDVSFLPTGLTDKFSTAISLGIKYDSKIVERLHIDEDAFDAHLASLNYTLDMLVEIVEKLLTQWGYDYHVIPTSVSIQSNEQLRALETFPHKTAATCAGLGWIGKCALLVTPEYGPRVKLTTILTNAGFKTANPVTRDKCGDCSLCVNACQCGAIKNVNWEKGVERDQLIDVYLCNQTRLDYIPRIGRKYSCGLCLQACRVGSK